MLEKQHLAITINNMIRRSMNMNIINRMEDKNMMGKKMLMGENMPMVIIMMDNIDMIVIGYLSVNPIYIL
jgi:hypothetical protein